MPRAHETQRARRLPHGYHKSLAAAPFAFHAFWVAEDFRGFWPVRTNATGFAEFNKKPDSKWFSVGGRLNFDLDVTLIF